MERSEDQNNDAKLLDRASLLGATTVETVRISELRALQSRVQTSAQTVNDYAEAIERGERFPRPTVVRTPEGELLVPDGNHTVLAHAKVYGPDSSIEVGMHHATKAQAIKYAAGANATHGLARSNADKRNSVMMALGVAECAAWSSRRVAALCGVSHTMVDAMIEERDRSSGNGGQSKKTERTGADGRTRSMPKKSAKARPKPPAAPTSPAAPPPAAPPQVSPKDASNGLTDRARPGSSVTEPSSPSGGTTATPPNDVAGGAPAIESTPMAAVSSILAAIDALAPEEREMLFAALRDQFHPPNPITESANEPTTPARPTTRKCPVPPEVQEVLRSRTNTALAAGALKRKDLVGVFSDEGAVGYFVRGGKKGGIGATKSEALAKLLTAAGF